MEYRRIQWDRETLYKAVWEKSSVQVAKEYGISDVALAKICRKLKVPKPGPGQQALVMADIKFQSTLPARDDAENIQVGSFAPETIVLADDEAANAVKVYRAVQM